MGSWVKGGGEVRKGRRRRKREKRGKQGKQRGRAGGCGISSINLFEEFYDVFALLPAQTSKKDETKKREHVP